MSNLMSLSLFSILIILEFCGCSLTQKKLRHLKTLNYIIKPEQNDKTLNIELQMQGSETGITTIAHAKTWGGSNFTDDITDFRILNSQASIKSTKNDDENSVIKIVTHKPSEKIKISYKVKQNTVSPDKTYRALISKKYFHLIGQSWLVTPESKNKDEVYRISLEFKGFPKNFKFANSFFVDKQHQTFQATLDEFLQSVYVGGDFRTKKINIKNKPLYVAIRGDWKFQDKDFFNLTKNIVLFQRDFFNDHDFDQFLITVIPNERSCCSSGGTGLTNSFATFLADDATLESHIKSLFSHELFHTWNGRRIERKEPEQLVYWFSEGFTDYYSRLLLLRSGDITLKEFIDDYNVVLYEYYTSEAINYPNTRILKNFWNDYQVEKLPYRRGNILARKWNAKVKQHSKDKHSLDNILLDFFKESQSKKTLVSNENFIRIANAYYPGGFSEDLLKYIENGETLVPGDKDLGPCIRRVKSKAGKFEHGYNSEKTYKSLTLTGVDPKSAAYKAGIRNGQRLLDRKINFPPTKPSWIKVADKSGVEKTITFLPIKPGKKNTAYFFELNEEMFKQNPELCLAWFNN